MQLAQWCSSGRRRRSRRRRKRASGTAAAAARRDQFVIHFSHPLLIEQVEQIRKKEDDASPCRGSDFFAGLACWNFDENKCSPRDSIIVVAARLRCTPFFLSLSWPRRGFKTLISIDWLILTVFSGAALCEEYFKKYNFFFYFNTYIWVDELWSGVARSYLKF